MSQIEKTCKCCNKLFTIPFKRRSQEYCSRECNFKHNKNIGRKRNDDLYEIRKCIICNNEFEVRKKQKKTMCSNMCRKIHNKKTKEFRIQKTKESVLNKYGVDSVFKVQEIQKIAHENFQKKYNVKSPMHVDVFKNKMLTTLDKRRLLKYIERAKNANFELISIISPFKVEIKCLKCKTIQTYTQLKNNKIPICRTCYPITNTNTLSDKIKTLLINNKISFESNNRQLIKPQEIDFLCLNEKLGIEVNGNYWYSENYGDKDSKYHLNKTKYANDNNINLIHIFEDEITLKPNIVNSRIKNKLGITTNKIFGRKCSINKLDINIERDFLNRTHIQGYTNSTIAYGLFFNNKLVSVMSFIKTRSLGKSNNLEQNSYELLRFSNELDTIVVGGFSKLLKYFIAKYKPSKIITYSDIRWNGLNTDNVYSKNGFKLVHQTPPNYWYVNTHNFNSRKHRYNFRKSELVKQGFDKNKTEKEIMWERGYDRIWDCGSFKFELEFNLTPTSVSFDAVS